MITNFFYLIGDAFKAMFEILPYIGRLTNILFIIIGAVGTIFWLWYMDKNKIGRKGYR